MRVDQITAPQQPSADGRLPNEVGMDREESLDGGNPNPGDTPEDDIIPNFPEEEEPEPSPTPPAAETPVSPTDSVPGDTPTDQKVPDGETIDKLLAKYRNDPQELAKALYNAQSHIGKQGNELGNLRKQVQVPQTQQPVTPAPEAPGLLPFKLPTPQERAALAALPIDPETGQRVTRDGQLLDEVDHLGIPRREMPYWQARANTLADQYPDATDRDIMFAVDNERRQFDQWRAGQEVYRVREIGQAQVQIATQHAPKLTEQLAVMFPANVAQGMVGEFYRVASQVLQDARARGVDPAEVNDPEALAKAMNLYYFTLFTNGQLIPLAEKVAAGLPNGNGHTPRASVPGQQSIAAPSIGGANSRTNGIRPGAKVLVDAGFAKSDEVDRLMSDDFKFDGT
jgi:phosphohistidine swiveling domain-containing protein